MLTIFVEEYIIMKSSLVLRRSAVTAICIALCIVLPMAFHMIPQGGKIFLPMHIPVLLCGLICGAPYGFFCGLLGPVLSSVLTGMPPSAILPSMTVELACYGLVAGIMIYFLKTNNRFLNLYTSLITAMLAGRVLNGIVNAFIFSVGSYSLKMWLTASFVTSLPGIVIQLAIIPSIVFALQKAKLMPEQDRNS